MGIPESIVELKSTKAQLEVGLIYLRRKHAELLKIMSSPESRHSRAPAGQLLDAQRQAREVADEIERRLAAIEDIAQRIQTAETPPRDEGLERLLEADEKLGAELATRRENLLDALRALAVPLKQYQELVEYKTAIAKQIAALTLRDHSYANYIECALLRQAEYEGELRDAIETIKRLRVVA